MVDAFIGITDRYLHASGQFERRLRMVAAGQWTRRTPCGDWDVRGLVNHMTQGNRNYVRLADGGTAEDFLRLRGVDSLGADPGEAYVRSVRECAEAFARPGALRRKLDYPLGPVTGAQALAVRTTDSVIHTWDLARALGADDILDDGLVAWVSTYLDEIYAGLAETPIAADTTHRFFAAAPGVPGHGASLQDRLLLLTGRDPAWT